MKRIAALDLAKGFIVLLMAPVHTMMLYSRPDVRETLLGKLFAFIAEWHGAQIFMLIMGIAFAFSKKHSFKSVLKRASLILAAAYALNIFKFVIPHLFGWLPEPLLTELQIQSGAPGFLQLFLTGDILQFAAVALLVLYFVYQIPGYHKYALIFAAIICFISPFFWDAHSNNAVVDYFLQLSGGQPPRVFFPLLPWIVYPLAGLSIGYYFQQAKEQKAFWLLRDMGWVLIICGFIAKKISFDYVDSFYRTYPFDTILHLGVVLVALSCWDWITLNVKQNHFFRLLTYLSEHITQVYIIQWVLICWLLPVFGYQALGIFSSVLCILLTSVLTFVISFSINTLFHGKRKAL